MDKIRKVAKERMKGYCRVCPVCNGVACAGEVPGMGGIGSGAAFRANLAALAGWRLNIRLIHEVTAPNAAVTLFGQTLDIPVLAAPIGGVAFNMGGAVSEEDYILSKLQGCRDHGILGCTGDGVPPFILKGIMTADQARLAVDAGAQGIVVSNHGGRVLDHAPGAAEVLPEIAAAVRGQITILADGGIRTGVDVLKMIALGADAVMVGRPFSVAAVGGLADGVGAYIDQLKTELTSAMVLTGCPDIPSVGMDILRPPMD